MEEKEDSRLHPDVIKKFLDSDYPLLDKFKSAASGTYRHSQNISAIAEAVASDLGLDATFMRVCATYHDIGKMLNPQYFTENQNGDGNPHDDLEPHISYQLITRHVSDSIMILMTETDMPREVMEVIAEHHGDTVIKAIYNKSESTNEDSFRYKCPKPSSEYASILMIVDAVEATARSVADKLTTPEAKIKVVKDTIDRLREDQQLDEMKVGTLRQVQNRLIRELDGIYHTRVDYDEEPKADKKTTKEED
jgi:putative nucleotidyltransferase with HDIG domain